MRSTYFVAAAFAFAINSCGKPEKKDVKVIKDCDTVEDADCRELKDEISNLEEKRVKAVQEQDLKNALDLTLQMNHLRRIKELYRQGEHNANRRAELESYTKKQQERLALAFKDHPAAASTAVQIEELATTLEDRYQEERRAPAAPTEQITAAYNELWESLKSTASDLEPQKELVYCRIETVAECRRLEGAIAGLRQQYNQPRSALAMAYMQEKLDLLKANHALDSEAVQKANRKYELLDELDETSALPIYSPVEHEAVAKVFLDYGELYIGETPANADGDNSVVEAVTPATPWSAYWYPKRSKEMFEGENSPLQKLDRLSEKLGLPLASAAWEKNNYMPFETDWAGLCDAWAMASILEPEPKEARDLEGMRFEIADLKALLIKKYEGYTPVVYGNRYFGNAASDGTIQDIRPEAFHRLIEVVLGEDKQPLIIDDDPGPEVWSKPIFKMRWVIKKDPEVANAYLVKAWPFMIKSRNEPSNDLTSAADYKSPVYEYRLHIDPRKEEDGKFQVLSGEWLNGSRDNHPDMVFLPNKRAAAVKPFNPEVAKGIEIIDAVFTRGTPVP